MTYKPTAIDVSESLAVITADNPACPALKWRVDPSPLNAHPHLSGSVGWRDYLDDGIDEEDPEGPDRVASIRAWARGLRAPIEVNVGYHVALDVRVTLPNNVRIQISEHVWPEHLPEDLSPSSLQPGLHLFDAQELS